MLAVIGKVDALHCSDAVPLELPTATQNNTGQEPTRLFGVLNGEFRSQNSWMNLLHLLLLVGVGPMLGAIAKSKSRWGAPCPLSAAHEACQSTQANVLE